MLGSFRVKRLNTWLVLVVFFVFVFTSRHPQRDYLRLAVYLGHFCVKG